MSDSSDRNVSGSTQVRLEYLPVEQMLRVLFMIGRSINLDSLIEKSGPLPASKVSIEAMPRFEVTEPWKDCAVCLEEFEVGGELREMPCKHGFHSGCIENWLRVNGSCPLCRFAMPVEEKDGDSDGEEDYRGGQRRALVVWLPFQLEVANDGMNVDSGSGGRPEYDDSDSSRRQSGADSSADDSSAMDMS